MTLLVRSFMTIKKQLFIFFALVIAAVQASHAAILLEPVVGYNVSGKLEANETADVSKDSSSGGGVAYGGRLGYQNMGFQIGLDYLKSNQALDDKNIKSDFESSEWAAFIGFRFPILLRVYAGYIFSANGSMKVDADLGAGTQRYDYDHENGTGAKFGLGWTLFPFLDLNLEYRKITYDEGKLSNDVKLDTTNNVFMLGVSLPFTF